MSDPTWGFSQYMWLVQKLHHNVTCSVPLSNCSVNHSLMDHPLMEVDLFYIPVINGCVLLNKYIDLSYLASRPILLIK